MDLTDELWELIARFIPPSKAQPGQRGRPPREARQCRKGILWILRTAARRGKILPARYGPRSTVHDRFQLSGFKPG